MIPESVTQLMYGEHTVCAQVTGCDFVGWFFFYLQLLLLEYDLKVSNSFAICCGNAGPKLNQLKLWKFS